MSELQSYVKTMGTHPDNMDAGVIPITHHHRDIATPANNVDTDPYANSPRLTDFYLETHGTRIPNFYQRRNAGELLPHTPFSQYKVEYTRSAEYVMWDRPPLWEVSNYILPVGVGFLPPIGEIIPSLAELKSIADDTDFEVYIQDASAAIATSGHDTLTFLAELHHLRRLFTGTLRKAIRIAQTISGAYRHSSRLSALGTISSAIAGMWLEQRYGFRILLFDFLEIEQVIGRLQSTQRTRFSERRGHTYRTVNEWSVPYTNSANGDGSFDYVEETEVSARGSVTADIIVDKLQFNVALTAWEIVPWSFVLDWFIHVGKAISALTFLSTVGDYSSSGGVQVKVHRVRTTNHVLQPNHGGTLYHKDSETVSTYNSRIPSPVTTTPLWRLRLDEYKVIDLIALIFQLSYRRS